MFLLFVCGFNQEEFENIVFLFRDVAFSCLKRKIMLLLPTLCLISSCCLLYQRHCLQFPLTAFLTRMLSFSWLVNSERHMGFTEKTTSFGFYILDSYFYHLILITISLCSYFNKINF